MDLPSLIQTLVGQGFKVMAPSGGWKFPSHYFFEMVPTQDRRAKCITCANAFPAQHNLAGSEHGLRCHRLQRCCGPHRFWFRVPLSTGRGHHAIVETGSLCIVHGRSEVSVNDVGSGYGMPEQERAEATLWKMVVQNRDGNRMRGAMASRSWLPLQAEISNRTTSL